MPLAKVKPQTNSKSGKTKKKASSRSAASMVRKSKVQNGKTLPKLPDNKPVDARDIQHRISRMKKLFEFADKLKTRHSLKLEDIDNAILDEMAEKYGRK